MLISGKITSNISTSCTKHEEQKTRSGNDDYERREEVISTPKLLLGRCTIVSAQVVMRAPIVKTGIQIGVFRKLEGLTVVGVVVLKDVTMLVAGVGQLVLVNVVIGEERFVPGVGSKGRFCW